MAGMPEGFEKLLLGIEEIDSQHLSLFRLIEALGEAGQSEERWLVAYQTLAALTHWSETHFRLEEALMSIMRYPERSQHQQQHAVFLQRLVQLKEQGLTHDVAADTACWLNDWLVAHVRVVDRLYVDWFERCVHAEPSVLPLAGRGRPARVLG